VNVGGSSVVVVVVLLVDMGGVQVEVSVGVVVDVRAGTGVVVGVVRVRVTDAGVDDGGGVVVSFGDVGVVNGAESTDGVDVCVVA